ncbi:Hypothetical protein PHPALM_3271 [Phytophthora palmivora]|uniref:Transposase n=1 Tax=Phytophthora palmivora TaxID=4796 RepID=A0A2P4YMT1_9STRA|nr:Hypothetical protein PHPALM_3271 [Phytophthora palmivora]
MTIASTKRQTTGVAKYLMDFFHVVKYCNNVIKRDYSLWTLLKKVALVEQLTLMCHGSRGARVFSLESKSNLEHQGRYKFLLSEGHLSII